MKCSACEKQAFKADLCRECLARAVERRARKSAGKLKLFKGIKIAVVNDGSAAGEVSEKLARQLITVADIKAIKLMPANPKKYGYVIIPETADSRAEKMLAFLMHSKKAGKAENAATLLGETLHREAEAYAEIKSIKYKQSGEESRAARMVREIEEKYRGTTHSLSKASSELEWES